MAGVGEGARDVNRRWMHGQTGRTVRKIGCAEVISTGQVEWMVEISGQMIELMTIGYEGLALPQFLEKLRRCRVTMLVDIRELPISRKPGFGKQALSAAVTGAGMKYEHIAQLGCPRDVRHDYRDDGDWEIYTRRFKAYLETQAEALERLQGWMEDERCCLLCFEEDFNFCHRSFVADRAAELALQRVRISHLTGPMKGRVVAPDLVPA